MEQAFAKPPIRVELQPSLGPAVMGIKEPMYPRSITITPISPQPDLDSGTIPDWLAVIVQQQRDILTEIRGLHDRLDEMSWTFRLRRFWRRLTGD